MGKNMLLLNIFGLKIFCLVFYHCIYLWEYVDVWTKILHQYSVLEAIKSKSLYLGVLRINVLETLQVIQTYDQVHFLFSYVLWERKPYIDEHSRGFRTSKIAFLLLAETRQLFLLKAPSSMLD